MHHLKNRQWSRHHALHAPLLHLQFSSHPFTGRRCAPFPSCGRIDPPVIIGVQFGSGQYSTRKSSWGDNGDFFYFLFLGRDAWVGSTSLRSPSSFSVVTNHLGVV
ncbi:hypothetical protein PanWU01x14_211970 [Parasponia andersonii]|uniref:Uncharacterized protein n=1 Tax=Parasponia andersonii TaxID=3476 RepID=A0A2P5BT80_PARAD|nr:hypothetical protein PanWU01x14_211970 [Parasponia andersonii]